MKLRTQTTVALCALLFCSSAVNEARAKAHALRTGSEVPGFSPGQAASTVRRDQLLADLKALSADDMEGRLVGTPGGAKARAYVIERFKAPRVAAAATSRRPFRR